MADIVLTEDNQTKWKLFVATLEIEADKVAEALKGDLGVINDKAIARLGSAEFTPDADLIEALKGVASKAAIRDAIHGIRNAPVAAPVPAPAPAPVETPVLVRAVSLPTITDDASLLDVLRTGGVAKMTPEDAVAAIRAAYTRHIGVTKIIPTLLGKLLEHAEAMEQPVSATYHRVKKAYGRRQYADVLEAFEGSVSSVPEADKKRFLDKVDTLWAVLATFQNQLNAYREADDADGNNARALVVAMRGGSVDHPPTTPVITAARGVIDRFNRVFGGLGIPAARTIAKDLSEEAKLLRDPELPAAMGVGSLEELIMKLSLNVPADARQGEVDIANFVLALLKLPDQPTAIQADYILELQRSGKSITWPTASVRPTAPAPRSGGRGVEPEGDGGHNRW